MTNFKPTPTRFSMVNDPGARADDFIDLERLWTIVQRNLLVVGLCIAIAAVLGLLYLRSAPPVYASQARILVDENISQVAGEPSSISGTIQLDTRIASQIEVLRSTRLALHVVDAQGLAQDPTFLSPPASPISSLLAPVRGLVALLRGPQEPATVSTPSAAAAAPAGDGTQAAAGIPDAAPEQSREERLRQVAAAYLQAGLTVSRVERSSVIGITYASHDPALAYRVADAYSQAFLEEQRLANADASSRATGWMETRLGELGEQQRQAALAVEEFRASNGLSVARGELVSEQRLAELTGQLAIGQSEVAHAQARASQLADMMESNVDGAMQNALFSRGDIDDDVVQQLRTRYLDMTRRIDQITTDFGADHPQVLQLTRERADLSGQLQAELRRLAAAAANEYEIAQNQQQALESAVSEQTGVNSQSGQALVELRELEQEALTLNTIYGNFLARYEETMQRESFPLSNLRVISSPVEPQRPIGPRFLNTMAVFGFLGLMAGCGFGALREFNERSFRIGADIGRHLPLRFLGYLPKFRQGASEVSALHRDGNMTQTAFAETLRNVSHVFRDLPSPRSSRVIGITSVLPGEGKTTVALHLARLLARTGSRVVLLDGDFRRPALNAIFAEPAEGGLGDSIRDGRWRHRIRVDPAGVAILPTPDSRDAAVASILFGSPAMARLIDDLCTEFDHVIVDLPPLGPVIDAKAFSPLADGLLLVVRWGKTPRATVRTVLEEEAEVSNRIVGAVLNATDIPRLKRYGDRGSRERAYETYQAYYTSKS